MDFLLACLFIFVMIILLIIFVFIDRIYRRIFLLEKKHIDLYFKQHEFMDAIEEIVKREKERNT